MDYIMNIAIECSIIQFDAAVEEATASSNKSTIGTKLKNVILAGVKMIRKFINAVINGFRAFITKFRHTKGLYLPEDLNDGLHRAINFVKRLNTRVKNFPSFDSLVKSGMENEDLRDKLLSLTKMAKEARSVNGFNPLDYCIEKYDIDHPDTPIDPKIKRKAYRTFDEDVKTLNEILESMQKLEVNAEKMSSFYSDDKLYSDFLNKYFNGEETQLSNDTMFNVSTYFSMMQTSLDTMLRWVKEAITDFAKVQAKAIKQGWNES